MIDCVWMLEKMIGRYAWGQVSRGGPRPMTPDKFFDANAPFVETVEQASTSGRDAGLRGLHHPWDKPISSPYLDRALRASRHTRPDGAWPWEEAFFPKAMVPAK